MTLAFGAIAHAGASRYRRSLQSRTTFALGLAACSIVIALEASTGIALSWRGAAILACAAVCAATDVQAGYVFDRVLLATTVAILPALACGGAPDAALGALVCGGALAIPYALSRGRAIGLADVKLAGTAGLALGLAPGLAALWVGCVCGGGVAAVALATGRAARGAEMPFGPFLGLGVCGALLMRPR